MRRMGGGFRVARRSMISGRKFYFLIAALWLARTRLADTYTEATGNRNAFMRWMGGEMAWPIIRQQTERRNFFLFSIYDLDLTGTDIQGIEHSYLGLFGQFIPLRQNNEVTVTPADS